MLTGPGAAGVWTPHDTSLLDEVAGVTTVRASGPIPERAGGWRGRADRLLDRQDAFTRWWVDAIVRAGSALRDDVDIVLAEVAPYETAFGAQALAAAKGVPWIADLQDPWALDEMWLYPSAVHRARARRQMRRSFASAAAVVMNTPEAAVRVVQAFPELGGGDRVLSIPNGFDPADFVDVAPVTGDGAFRIVHTGYLHTEFALDHQRSRRLRRLAGGMPIRDVDFLTRSHVYLLEAVAKLELAQPELRGSIEVHLVGNLTAADRDVAAPYPFVQLHGFRPHAETIAVLKGADLLFLPMHDLPQGTRAGLVPSKTYEYVASGRPILAAVPDGDARDLLARVGSATLCRPAAVECLSAAIHEAVRARQAGTPLPRPNEAVVAEYDYRRLAARMASLIERVLG